MCLLFFSCEQEELVVSPNVSPDKTQYLSFEDTGAYDELKTVDLSKAHVEGALAFHQTIEAIGSQADEFVENAMADARLNPPVTERMLDPFAQIDDLVAKGQLPAGESMAARRMIEFLGEVNKADYRLISEMKGAFADWRADARVSQTETPLVYHVSVMLELISTTDQLSLSSGALSNINKSDDGQICVVRHRNWLSERLGLCADANESLGGNIIRIAIIAAATVAIAGALIAVAGTLIAISEDAIDIVTNVVRALVGAGLIALWDETWCKLHCDNCDAADGIVAVFSGCNFQGIRATGGPFDFNEGVIFRIDENRDGQADFTVTSNPGSITSFSTQLPRNDRFQAQADVICDGNTVIPWEDPRQWISITPTRTVNLPPTVNLNSPDRDTQRSYRSGRELAFSATILTNGWIYQGWSAEGASPSSGGGRSFTITYQTTGIDEREIIFRFRNPCTNETLEIIGDSFLVCSGMIPSCP